MFLLLNIFYKSIKRIYVYTLPISLATSINLDSVLEISTILMPRLANSLAYSFPMPSVEPVTTVYGHCSMFQ